MKPTMTKHLFIIGHQICSEFSGNEKKLLPYLKRSSRKCVGSKTGGKAEMSRPPLTFSTFLSLFFKSIVSFNPMMSTKQQSDLCIDSITDFYSVISNLYNILFQHSIKIFSYIDMQNFK